MEYPALYKRPKNGNKWMVWKVSVLVVSAQECIVRREYGYEDGKVSVSDKSITKGKHIGKKNETSVYDQACMEAASLWKKQMETHLYTETKEAPPLHPGDTGPMLAHSFDKHSNRIRFPCYTQAKLDGVRMRCKVDTRQHVTCLSRTGKPLSVEPLQNIIASIKTIISNNPSLVDTFFDGELYTSELLFEDIVGLCRNRANPDKNKYDKLVYHVYDVCIPSMDYDERFKTLTALFAANDNNSPYVRLVDTTIAPTLQSVFEHHDQLAAQGYEGVMVRNRKGMYVSGRSYDLQKFKRFEDKEYLIIDWKEAEGNDKGTAILQCQTDDGGSFWVRPRGTREYRASLLDPSAMVKGKWLTVRYQNLTDKGMPRFPVGIAIRDYE